MKCFTNVVNNCFIYSQSNLTHYREPSVRFLINAVWAVSCLARAGQRMDLSTTAKIQITKENESRCREETMDIFGVKKDAKRSFFSRDRREFGVLQSTLGDLRKDNETRIRHYEDDMRNLQWALYNLRLEQTGKNGQLIPERTSAFRSMKGYLLILPSLEVTSKTLQKNIHHSPWCTIRGWEKILEGGTTFSVGFTCS